MKVLFSEYGQAIYYAVLGTIYITLIGWFIGELAKGVI